MKILITGGHLTPALGFIDWIRTNRPDCQLVFVGRLFSQTRLKQKAIEQQEVEKRQVVFNPLDGARFPQNIYQFPEFLIGFFSSIYSSYKIIRKESPSVILTFGGYLAVPVVLVGWLLKIPVITHEGTRVLGKANKLICKLATRVAYTYSSLLSFKTVNGPCIKNKMILTGTPLRETILQKSNLLAPKWLNHLDKKPIILVLGGNQGSLAINRLISSSLAKLCKKWVVVHQCGRSNLANNYLEEMKDNAKSQGVSKSSYFVKEWLDEADLVWLYQNSQLAITRAGANTIEELIYHSLPAIFIPLPHSIYNEQYENANYLLTNGAAELLPQELATCDRLLEIVAKMTTHNQAIKNKLLTLDHPDPTLAAAKIFKLVKSCCCV